MVTATETAPFGLNSRMVLKHLVGDSTIHSPILFVRSSGQAGTVGHLSFFVPRGRASGFKALRGGGGGRGRRESLFLSIFLASS